MSEPFIGEIRFFGFNFAPRGWAFCDGQMMSIAQQQTLFALLGTIYGGDGRSTFALPDLRGRVPMNQGAGPGLTSRRIGERAGHENVTLQTAQMPAHNHSATLHAETGPGTTRDPGGNMLANPSVADVNIYALREDRNDKPMNSASIVEQTMGNNQPHENMPPFLVLNACIALDGIFPSRN